MFAFALVSLTACGDDDTTEAVTPGTGTEGTTETTAPDGGDGDDAAAGGSSLEFVALDIEFESEEANATAGELDVSLVNEGEIEHTWLVEDHEDELKLEVQQNGDVDEGTMSLAAGEYTYYCDVPGHRAAGMEGTLTVE